MKLFGLDLEKKPTILDGFFPYLAQMITTMRGCVAYNDLWPWPISSRSFGLDLENRVLSVASTVLDGFFPYLVQMITSMRRCVACDDLWPWPISSRSFDLDFENRVRSIMFSALDRLFFWLGIQYDPIVWVIMKRRGVSSEHRRSSCSSSISIYSIWNHCLTEVMTFCFCCCRESRVVDTTAGTWRMGRSGDPSLTGQLVMLAVRRVIQVVNTSCYVKTARLQLNPSISTTRPSVPLTTHMR